MIFMGLSTISSAQVSNNAQEENKSNEKKEADGVMETAELLGDSLWYQFKKRFNLLSEEEEKQREEKPKGYKVKIGKLTIER